MLPKMVSASTYAAHRGCSLQAVSRAIDEGRISSVHQNPDGSYLIDVLAADREWTDATSPLRGGDRSDSRVHLRTDLLEAQVKEKEAAAEWRVLQTSRLAGETTTWAEVDAYLKPLVILLRGRLMDLPRRMAAELSVTDTPKGCELLVESNIRAAIEQILEGLDSGPDQRGVLEPSGGSPSPEPGTVEQHAPVPVD